MKYIFLICDGMADRINGPTPLESAEIPNFNKIAEMGKTGSMYTVNKGFAPESDEAHLSLFGYNLDKYYPGRGPMEALGAGISLKKGDVAFRANIATIDEIFTVKDRRAGRIKAGFNEIVKAINSIDLGIDFKFYHTIGHRGVLVLKDCSEKITDTDPHETGKKVLKSKPIDTSKEAEKTAELVNKFTELTYEALKDLSINKERELPANVIILRGPGKYKQIPSFKETTGLKGACIATMTVVRGAAAYVGMDLIDVKGATGNENTNIKNKFLKALEAIKKYDFVLMNIKATDLFGHDGDFEGKKKMIEKIDKELPILMEKLDEYRMVFTADHATPVSVRDHSSDPVMLAVAGPGISPDNVSEFSERACSKGELGTINGHDLLKTIKNLS